MKRWIQWGSLLVLSAVLPSMAADTGVSTGEVQKVEVFPSNGHVLVEVTLSTVVTPSVEAAQNPSRLVLKLPGITSDTKQKHIGVEKFGVQVVRYGLHQANPLETDLVVDLEQERTYKLSSNGTKILLLIEPAPSAVAKRQPPAAAAKGPLLGMHRGSSDSSGSLNTDNSGAVLLTPPPSQPPIAFPPAAESQPSASAASNPAGDVFPSAEGADSSGKSNQTPHQSSANATVPPGSAEKPSPQEPKLSTSASPEAAPSVRPDANASLPASSGQNAAPSLETPNQNVAEKAPADGAQETAESADHTGTGEGQVAVPVQHQGENSDFHTAFRVKYVAEDAAYLDGGRSSGLTEGMKLVVRDLPNGGSVAASGGVAATGADGSAAGDVAELEVLSVAETSAVTEIHTPKRPVKVGDLVYLSSADQQALVEKNALSATRKYPAVVSFTENDTLDDEVRDAEVKPPLPSVNRARGRFGFDYIGVHDGSGSGMTSSNLGMVVQADITRLNGTYWNVSGYWRGRMDKTSAGPQTLQDLINRTYHLYTNYTNPNSDWVAGFGRMYLPWATSLDTIDGGYFGRKVGSGATAGLFMGSTPDPTSYSYDPKAELSGAFINFEGGSYDDLHYSSTSGAGVGMQSWSVNRPFVFFENTIFYKRYFSIYQAAQLDNRAGYWYTDPTQNNAKVWQPGTGWGAGRSFTTVRFQPYSRVEFNFNHTYLRDLPTFNVNLVDTGLLDKFLFQGFSAGARVEVARHIWLSTDLGLNNRSGDKKNSMNQMFGLTIGRVPWIGIHADMRYTRFNSGFGSGSYEALSFSKNISEAMQLQVLAGQQNFSSGLTSATRSRFVNAMWETNLGQHYFVQAGGTISRGSSMSYNQWMFTFGYRFDNRHGHSGQ